MPERPPSGAPRARAPLRVLARFGPLIPLLAGAALLVAAELSTLYEVWALDAMLDRATGGEHHGYALLIVAGALVPMAWGAVVGRSVPAAVACVVLAAVAAGVVALVDAPAVGDASEYERSYEFVEAGPGAGFILEIAGAILMAAGALWAMAAALVVRPRPHARPRTVPSLNVPDPVEKPAAVPASHPQSS